MRISAMWFKIINFFTKGRKSRKKRITNEEIIEELRSARKLLRKQGIFQEAFKGEVLKQIEEKNLDSINPIMEFTDSLFYLGTSFKEIPDLSRKQYQAVEIVWQKWETLISSIDIEIISQAGVKFDPRLYEAVEKVSQGTHDLTVIKVIQPGYLHKGRVARPAKAIIKERDKQGGGVY